MKFDPYAWNEAKPDEKIQAGQGVLRVRCSAPAPLYIEAEGFEALAGVGTDHTVEVTEPVSFRVSAPKGTRVFWMPPARAETVAEPQGEVFTNVDRMPHESGTVAEITRARRSLELERRQMLKDIRAEAATARASLRNAGKPAPTVDQGEGEPEALVDAADDEAEA